MEEQKIKKKRKSLWRKIVTAILLCVVAIPLLLFSTAAILLTPKRLTPIALRLTDNLLLADLRFDTLNVSLFQEFPYINLTVKNGNIRSRVFDGLPPQLQSALPERCDSLLNFEELSVSLNIKKLLQYKIDIRRVRLRNATVNAYISPSGLANWEIWESDTTLVEPSVEVPSFHLNLQRLIIRDGFHVHFRSDPDSLTASLQLRRLFLRGEITLQPEEMKLEILSASALQINASYPSPPLLHEPLPFFSSSIDSMRITAIAAPSSSIDSMKITAIAAPSSSIDNLRITAIAAPSFSSSIDSLRITAIGEERYSLLFDSHNSLILNNITYAQSLPLALFGEIGFSFSRLDSLFLKDFTLTAAQIPIHLDGNFVMDDPSPRIRLECAIDNLPFADLISLIPPSLLSEGDELKTDISAKIRASVNYPAYTVDIATSGGYLSYPPENAYIHTFALDATYTHHPERPERSGINLRQCNLEASGISLHAQGHVQNPLENPDIDLTLKGAIRLDTLLRILPVPDNITARGALTVDASAKFLWSNFLRGDLNASSLRGRVEAERFMLRLPQDSIFFMARSAHLSFGSNLNQRDTLIEQGAQMLRLSFRADSANIRYKQQLRLAMGSTRLSARSAASALDGDTTRIHPFNGSFETRFLSLQTADSIQVRLNDGSTTFSFRPAPHDPSLPIISANIRAQLFQMSDPANQFELTSPHIALQTTRLSTTRSQNRTRSTRSDSLQTHTSSSETDASFGTDATTSFGTDSTTSSGTDSLSTPSSETDSPSTPSSGTGSPSSGTDATTSSGTDSISTPSSDTDAISSSETDASTSSGTPSSGTPSFSIPSSGADSTSTPSSTAPSGATSPRTQRTSLPPDDFASGNLDLEMDRDTKRLLRQWQLEGAIQAEGGSLSTPYFPLPITLGETDIEFSTDEIQLMQTEIRAGRSSIECTGKISNLRQVMLGRGNLNVYGFLRSDTLDLNELMQAANAGSLYTSSGTVVKEIEEASSLIIIPANLILNVKLFTDYTHYGNEYFAGLSGSLTSRSRTLQINNLEASSSIGDFKLSALYATRSRNNITAGFDLEMKKVQVDRLIALIPSIDTLAPMLRSFEGVVDCIISATTSMDTSMNLLLPTLKAACRIQGENMVLLDGETFTEISKMLQFTKKSKNLIDHIGVDFLIHNSQIQVFPFIFEMDRYRAAVSGLHNFDMSFNYHISVLRSPLPFRLGVDVSGTLDDTHYRLARCRYRDANIPSYVELINSTRISLLEAIKAFDPASAFGAVERTVSRAAAIVDDQ